MRVSTTFFALALPLVALAAPIRRADAATPPDTSADQLVFKFAHVLEQLETEFYTQALAKFAKEDFVTAGFSNPDFAIEAFTAIQLDESTHTSVLDIAIKALGAEPLTTCTFDFSSVLTDVSTMVAVARLVENVGVGAYLGAANLLTDGRFSTAAASILTVEARHQTYLNLLNGAEGIPQAFDIPLSPGQVLSLAGPFISGCDLGVPALPTLTITNTGTVGAGTALTFKSPALDGLDTSNLFCNMIVGGATAAISLPFNMCVVPNGIIGPVAISIVNGSQPLLNSPIDAASATLVTGVAMAFIDFGGSSFLGNSIRPGAGGSSGGSGSGSSGTDTSTISPDEASSIASGATGSSGEDIPSPTTFGSDGLPEPSSTSDNGGYGGSDGGPVPTAPPAAGNAGVQEPNPMIGQTVDVGPMGAAATTTAPGAASTPAAAGSLFSTGADDGSSDTGAVVLGWDSPQ